MSLGDTVQRAEVIVCAGPGGVGKTTTAAALGLEAARRGRRAVVVTIDPAKRLADALGLPGGLTNDPAPIDLPAGRRGRSRRGELWAMMLDTGATFDSLVRRYSPSPAQAEQILTNAFYRNMRGALSGTQEYMAAEKLHELHTDERFDVVIVDTPPSRNALDFLDAPARLTRFLDHRLYRALMLPTRVGLRVVNVAAQAFVKTVAKVVGGDVIGDVVTFFQAFEGMEHGFRTRAHEVAGLLRDPGTAYVVVTSPRLEAIDEAQYFADRLRAHHVSVSAVVVNRMHPSFGSTNDTGRPVDPETAANLAELTHVAAEEASMIRPLLTSLGDVPMVSVPLLVEDVHDLGGLGEIVGHLFAPAGAAG